MQILLMCAHEYGSVAFHAQWIDGHHAPQRRYEIRNHQIILDNGLAEPILHHDTEELLAMPSGLYRMPTPDEQEAFVKARDQAMTIQEQTEEQELTEDVEQEQEAETPDAPPALENQPAKRKYTRKK